VLLSPTLDLTPSHPRAAAATPRRRGRPHLLLVLPYARASSRRRRPRCRRAKLVRRGGGSGPPWPWAGSWWRRSSTFSAVVVQMAVARRIPGPASTAGDGGGGRAGLILAHMGLDGNKLPWLLSTSTTAPSGSPGLGPHHEEAGGFGPRHGGSGLLLILPYAVALGVADDPQV
jgi:hypothetical protein